MPPIAAIATANAIIRAADRFISPIEMPGSRTPRLRNSTPKVTVATACRKNSTPPVTSSWLIGSAASTGRMMNWCIAAPSAATTRMPAANAPASGQPCSTCSHQIAYMPIIISSA